MLRQALLLTAWIMTLSVFGALPGDAGPVIGTLHPSECPRANTRFELTFTLSDIYPKGNVFTSDGACGYNPFRYETTSDGPVPTAPGVNVRAEVTQPGGSVTRVDGFWCVEYRYLGESRSGFDRIVPINHPQTGTAEHWHVRFIPPAPGRYTVTVYADDPDPTSLAVSSSISVDVAESPPGNHGLLRTSEDGSRLEYADGYPYCQFGIDMPQGCAPIAHVPTIGGKSGLDVLAAAGGNYVRRWLVNTHREDVYRGISWHAASGEVGDESVARSGKRSVRLSAGCDPVVAVDRSLIGCLPNRTYAAGIWFKGAPGAVGSIRMVVGEDNGSGETLRTRDWIPVSEEWTQARIEFTTGAGAKWLHFKPEFSAGVGDAYLDDLDLRDVTPGSAVDFCMIQNPSFERWSPVELDVANLWRADYFLQACERLGIVAQLTLFDYRLWDPADGFFTAFYGDTFWGDLSSGTWQETESIRQQKRLLRYLAARFGGYPSLGLWELTNEMSRDWSTTQYEWLKDVSAYVQAVDTATIGSSGLRPMTNSFWKSPPGVVGYEQIPTIPVSSAHYYIYSDTHPDMRSRTPGWGIRRENIDDTDWHSSPLAYHAALSYGSVKWEDTLIEKSIGIRPGRRYRLQYWLKALPLIGENPAVRVQCFRHDSFGAVVPGGNVEQITTPPVEWGEHEMAWTAGPLEADVNIRFQVTNFLAGELWFDDMRLLESEDGVTWRDIVYNADLTLSICDDDELTWALQNDERSRTWYGAGPNGIDRAWISGEFGLYAWSVDLGTWVCSSLVDADTAGVHSHNAVWAQTMVSGARNSPTYWFAERYMLGQAASGRDVYTPTWKGITAFLGRLPFRSGSHIISTDPYYSQVSGVQSTDPRIRIIGQKKANDAYFWVSNSTNTWANRIQGGSAAVGVSAIVTIPGFDAGVYRLSNYDAWTGNLILETTAVVGPSGQLIVSVNGLSTDTAFIVTQAESCPPPPEDGARVDLWNMVVISGWLDGPGMYVESPNRSWAAEVIAPWGTECVRGDRVHIQGACRVVNCRRQIVVSEEDGDCFEVCGTGPQLLPVGMRVRDLKGILPPSVPDEGRGPANPCLLVTCWGKVLYSGPGYFVIEDGSTSSGAWVDAPFMWPPQDGDRVMVTGINCTGTMDYQVMHMIRPRDEGDVQVLQ